MARQPARAATDADVQALRRQVTTLQTEIDRIEKSAKAAGEQEERFRLLVERAKDMIWRLRWLPTKQYEYVSPAAAMLTGYTPEEWYADPELGRKIVHPEDRRHLDLSTIYRGTNNQPEVLRWIRKDGTVIWTENDWNAIKDHAGNVIATQGTTRDVTERVRSEAARECRRNVLEMISMAKPLPEVLEAVIRGIEEQLPDVRCSVLLTDEKGKRLLRGAAPTLSNAFNEAVDGLEIGPRAGSCGTAAFRRETVIVEDIATDPLWESFRDLAADEGLGACWSIPVLSEGGKVLGTLCMYYRDPRRPRADEIELMETASSFVGIVIERQEAGEALRESEERFRLLAENAHDIVYYFRLAPTPSLEYISSAAEAILGYTPAEFLGYPDLLTDIIHPEDRHLMGTLLQNDEYLDQPITLRVLPKHGGMKSIELSRSVIHDDSGQPVAIQGIVRDVTERVQQEEALRKSEERFRLLANNAQDMIYRYRVIEPRGYDYISPACERIFGYTPEECYANPEFGSKVFHPDDRTVLNAIRRDRGAVAGLSTVRCITKNGNTVWVEMGRTPIRDDAGTVVAVEGIARDVTERMEAEVALKRSWEWFRLLAENAQDIVYSVRVRPERKVEYVSPSIERILGYRQEEYYADPSLVERTIHEDDRRLSLLDSLMGETESQPQRLRCIARDGRTVWMERRSSPIRDADGEIVGWYGISRDVTEQVRLLEQLVAGEERLRAFSRHLVETQEADRRFIALELHDEIGQMLTGIKMFLEKLGRIGKSNKWLLKNAFELVEDAMDRVQDLSLELRPAMLDHLGIVPTLRWYVKRYASRNGVEVRLRQSGVDRRFDPDLETAVYRIVQEGLTNVARHAGTDRATVQFRIIDGVLQLSVEDSGQGFDANTVLESPKSVGLVGMIERATSLGGELRVDSAPGHGTRLNATFPLNGNPRAAQ